jgi:hypothetical protein
MRCKDVVYIQLGEDKVHRQVLMEMMMNIWVQWKQGIFEHLVSY